VLLAAGFDMFWQLVPSPYFHFTKQEKSMPKYMVQASYTSDGTKGLMKEGGTKRRATVEANVKAAGGTVEAFYFAFGDADAFVIVDLPDNASAAALSLAVNASGAVTLKTHVLLTPEEVDRATKKSVKYRAPGRK
jgi:uncharacterized protein with GYD domain